MHVTHSSVRIDAAIETVWTALTEPSYVKQWQFGSDLATDWNIGSPIMFSTEWEGATFKQWGTVLHVERPTELRYSLFAPRPDLEDAPENYFTMIYKLKDNGDSVDLTISQEDDRPGAAKGEEVNGEENPLLAGLKALAESL